LTQARLHELCAIQARIIDETFALVAPGGTLAYATCSLLDCENGDQVSAFRNRHPEWQLTSEVRLTPLDGADGFYLAALTREHLAG
jgi:16S rRNA (cytosine967-C5)-methyltransferase